MEALAPLVIASFTDETHANHSVPFVTQGVTHGTAYFSSGHIYTGDFFNGRMHGRGCYKWRDGVVYQGTITENKLTGTGTYYWTDGSRYEGEILLGLRHGVGTFTGPNETCRYTGEWKQGKRHGFGKLIYDKEGLCYYEGFWFEDKKHGKGLQRYATGNTFNGDWQMNVKHGHGKMHWESKNESYEGEWQNDLPNGQGEYIWHTAKTTSDHYPTQNRYIGTWHQGQRNGPGTYIYATGAWYKGTWLNNQKHGQGVYVDEHGRRYIGEWQNDRMMESEQYEWFSNDCPFAFNLSMILQSESEDLDHAVKRVNHVFIRHISFLRQVYQWYSELSWWRAKDQTSRAMTRLHLWKLFQDSGLHERHYSLVDLDRAIALAYVTDNVFLDRYIHPHSPFHEFIFQQFLSSLVHVAHHFYMGKTDVPLGKQDEDETHPLEEALNRFIVQDLMVIKEKTASKSRHQKVLLTHLGPEVRQSIFDIYNQLAHPQASALPHSKGDKTLTLREFLFLLKSVNVIDSVDDSPNKLTVSKILELFGQQWHQISVDGCFNLEFEMTIQQFYDLLIDCAKIKSRSSDPLVKMVPVSITPSIHSIAPQLLRSEFDLIREVNPTPPPLVSKELGTPVKPPTAGMRRGNSRLAEVPGGMMNKTNAQEVPPVTVNLKTAVASAPLKKEKEVKHVEKEKKETLSSGNGGLLNMINSFQFTENVITIPTSSRRASLNVPRTDSLPLPSHQSISADVLSPRVLTDEELVKGVWQFLRDFIEAYNTTVLTNAEVKPMAKESPFKTKTETDTNNGILSVADFGITVTNVL